MQINLTEELFKKIYTNLSAAQKEEAIAELGLTVDTEFEVVIRGSRTKGVTTSEFFLKEVVNKTLTLPNPDGSSSLVEMPVTQGDTQLMPIKAQDLEAAIGMILNAIP
ncbi:hypothetical protein P1X15_10065 [Runella sp. MFBS21]|uniref:hypothetical protein n=1 Tax=Runella sp. MFBS21 TaxID=3034018 RepID=UPI0023F74DBE|nr:hypothetical protein [Runella sp. MFBS21]MDF7817943.1 hypothetical protein [Runella sp. MFBS21]